jgi:sterol 3beta-glucosyltransferase
MDTTMESYEPPEKRSGPSKLVKRRNLHRLPSARIPERLRSHGEDMQEDVTAPSHGAGASRYMNQSIFSMIAAAGSKTDFNARFDESSDSDEGSEDEPVKRSDKRKSGVTKDAASQLKAIQEQDEKKGHKKKLSQHKLLQSLPKLSLRPHSKTRKAPQDPSPPSDGDSSNSNPRDAPMMSRLLTAEAEFEADIEDVETPTRQQILPRTRDRKESSPATLLAVRLMEIFGFEKPEKVVAEFPCWLLQSVLLQGYLYITRRHICFYAYLPKKSSTVSKNGYLAKRGRRNLTYTRFWFTLKGDVLSYFTNPSDQYFPQGNVDLRYGISASLSAEKERHKDCKDFTVTTDHRTYHFRADSPSSAQEWVKILQKTIFRSHNDGDSVKISLPVENVIDVEESPVVEFAETLKIRVVESGDSYAIDEYFFSFFSFGKEVFDVLQDLVEGTPASRLSQDLLSPTGSQRGDGSPRNASPSFRKSFDVPVSGASTPPIRENVKATLVPFQIGDDGKLSPRMSGEFSRPGNRTSLDIPQREYSRASFDRGRSSEGRDRLTVVSERRSARSPLARHHDSSDENDKSVDKTDSSMAMSPTADAHMSASQILTRSDVFQKPTLNRMDTLQSASTEDAPRESIETIQSTDREGQRPAPIKRHSSRFHRRKNVGFDMSAGASDAGSETKMQAGTASPSLQDIVKAGSYPLQRAGAFAGYLKNSSTRMSKLLATESMSYLEKVSGMWAGSRKHYGENEGIVPDDRDVDPEDEEASVGHGDRFRTHFALPKSEKLQATYFGFLHRVLPLYGKIYISNRKFCFRSLLPGTRTKLVLPLKDIENVDKEKGFRFGYHGLVIVIRGHEELFFEFSSADHRDDCTVTLLHSLETVRYMVESGLLVKQDEDDSDAAKAEHKLLQEARRSSVQMHDIKLPETVETIYSAEEAPPILFDDPRASVINFKPTASLRITCLTIGSRGDVQPYIALCKGLLKEGHKPKIATHAEFGPWVIKHGIAFEAIDGDPAELMRICVENGMFTYSFLKEASTKFRGWIDELLVSAWRACQDSDILIESPSAMAGIHIAEALGIPYFRAFTMPWTRTRAYPHAFAVPEHKIGGAYNYFSYVMFDNVFWKAIAGQVNRWRKKELGLRSTNLDKMQPNKVPFLYNFSPHVVVPPLDYSDWVRVTGYWFLDEANDWTPPAALTDFIAKAREDDKKLVYIGFGSIVVSDPAALTRTVVDSVLKADVRCILSKGWSDRLGDPTAVKTEVPLPDEIHQIKSAPHDWLFAQIDAAVHHGGAGTTGASLRAGLPTVIKPFFGDQYFFGSRVEDLGVGICLKKVNVSVFSRALWEATHSERMIVKARILGEQIRKVSCVPLYLITSKLANFDRRKTASAMLSKPSIETWTTRRRSLRLAMQRPTMHRVVWEMTVLRRTKRVGHSLVMNRTRTYKNESRTGIRRILAEDRE